MDRSTSGEVEIADLLPPTIGIPCPVCDRVINECRPSEDEEKE